MAEAPACPEGSGATELENTDAFNEHFFPHTQPQAGPRQTGLLLLSEVCCSGAQPPTEAHPAPMAVLEDGGEGLCPET